MSIRSLRHDMAPLSEVNMHYVVAGDGPTVMLLHGWPQTWFEFRHLMDELSNSFQVVTPDLRGLGDTSRPQAGYDLQSLASDIIELSDHLDLSSCAIVGHDLGGPVAYMVAAMERTLVSHLGFVEAPLPGIVVEGSENFFGQLWHMGFHAAGDIAEALIAGRERMYLTYFYKEFAYNKSAFSAADIDQYVQAYTAPGALHAGMNYYRSLSTWADQIAAIAPHKLAIPCMAYGGVRCLGEWPMRLLSEVANDVHGGTIDRCGHWVSEERPDFLVQAIRDLCCR